MRLATLLLVALLAGCDRSERLFPLSVGHRWTYTVKNGLAEFVQHVEVTRTVPVGGQEGFELSSPMGTSRLSWKGGVLFASTLGGVRINPPLPILVDSRKPLHRDWKGRLFIQGRTQEATGELVQQSETLNRAGREIKAVKTTLSVNLEDRRVEVQTWYASGIGPLTQVQRTYRGSQERFDLAMDYLTGP